MKFSIVGGNETIPRCGCCCCCCWKSWSSLDVGDANIKLAIRWNCEFSTDGNEASCSNASFTGILTKHCCDTSSNVDLSGHRYKVQLLRPI